MHPSVEVGGLRLVVVVVVASARPAPLAPFSSWGHRTRSAGSGLRPAMQAAPTVEVGGLRLVVTVASVNLHR
ncbi:hypothetical protein [Rhodoferax antarcticus]|uniref:hypothetical protein n=1 Tax=Rhodoferax antarcticus TaxID=81479 RepID=UPI0012EB880F|nr:hypothetical protein [Rhodoferax antarcticus]